MSSTSSSSFYVPQKGTLGKALAAPPATSKLFSPFKIRDIEFPNRVFVSPMCMYSCQDGMATDFHLVRWIVSIFFFFIVIIKENETERSS
ncbi:hypothetical protein HMI54_015252 [Coelomomyces lativittatus]|nr:hypothetical protein HMI54_015252 [Coelomomyces lativittatus]